MVCGASHHSYCTTIITILLLLLNVPALSRAKTSTVMTGCSAPPGDNHFGPKTLPIIVFGGERGKRRIALGDTTQSQSWL